MLRWMDIHSITFGTRSGWQPVFFPTETISHCRHIISCFIFVLLSMNVFCMTRRTILVDNVSQIVMKTVVYNILTRKVLPVIMIILV